MFTKENVKHVVISIFIGAGIAFVSTLLQGLLDYVKTIDLNATGILSGIGFYLLKWRTTPIG